jgi:hypothetical protein
VRTLGALLAHRSTHFAGGSRQLLLRFFQPQLALRKVLAPALRLLPCLNKLAFDFS